MAVAALKFISEDEYLVSEEIAEHKHEYFGGQIFAMAGSSPEHALITSNVGRELGNLSKNGNCRVYSSDLRIRVERTGLNTYPDISVVCGDLRTTERAPRACTNPTLIVEVLSGSTQEYDRGEKWRHYQTIESLTDYLLVWQDRSRVEHYARQVENAWTYRLIEGLENTVQLHGLNGEVSLREIYRAVQFPPLPFLRSPNAEDTFEEAVDGNP
jgi:Uma2 family endonuclease